MPSVQPNTPTSPVIGATASEAVASVISVIGSDVAGIPYYLIDDKNRLLCSPGHANAPAEQLRVCDS